MSEGFLTDADFAMEIDVSKQNDTDKVEKGKTKRTPRKEDDGAVSPNKRKIQRVVLSVTKPLYNLQRDIGFDARGVRSEHRRKLRHLLRQLLRRKNWNEASGVLSVLLKVTHKEKSVSKNRTKYWATMELLQHLSYEHMTPREMEHVFQILMKKMKYQSLKDKFEVQLQYIIFNLAHGNTNEAYQGVTSLIQERGFDSDAVSNLVAGLTFFHMWYTGIKEELQLEDPVESYTPIQSETSGSIQCMRSDGSDEGNAVETYEADSAFHQYTSIRIGKEAVPLSVVPIRTAPVSLDANLQRGVPNHEQSNDNQVGSHEVESSSSIPSGNSPYASIFYARGLESWLMPLKLPSTKQLEDFLAMQGHIHNDCYKNAVKHLQSALYLTPPALEALLPLIQMLLLGDQVKKAVNEVDKVIQISDAVLPLRLKSALMEHICQDDSFELWTFFEATLKRDPTCCHSLARLINIHRDGYYSAEKLLEMLASHLDATYAKFEIWEEFAACFMKLSQCNEDNMSSCLVKIGGQEQNHIGHFNRMPAIFTDSTTRKNWRLRCRWWLTRHFSHTILASEFDSGNLELLTYKASSAAYLYGRDIEYVVKVSAYLKEENENMSSILNEHMQKCVGFYLDFRKKSCN